MGPAVTAHLPLGRVHVDVPMSRGEHAQWPRTAVPTQALEAAAQDWYEYRDGSCLVAAWNSYQGISLATALCFAAAALAMLAGGPAAGTCRASPLRELCPDSGDAGKEGMVYSIIVALNIVGLAYVVFSCYFTHAVVPRLRGEVSCRLAAPLSRALASASWSVEAHYVQAGRQQRDETAVARCTCCIPGWIWLDFVPLSAQVLEEGRGPSRTAKPELGTSTGRSLPSPSSSSSSYPGIWRVV
ncbi:unnamed protein product [Prorocentrum cordatum]|uniref:Protein S-acyltransferase n=2 Tax=Prorocentrum cordatum TaxID=2364126 RepID=A0ABN9US93_9DINO|nr:unnamed protein product [Polarella glacialis]